MNESASLSEIFLAVWPVIFGLDLSRYLVAAGLAAIVLAVFAVPLAARRIQTSRAKSADVRREIGLSFSTVVLFSLVGFGLHIGSNYGIFRLYDGALPSVGRLAIEFGALVLLHDAYFYWAHRAMHTRWLFRRVHRLHHKSRTPTPWAAYAFAPPEALLEAAILPFAAMLFPVHELAALLFVTHMIVRNVIGHAGVELFPAWWLDSPLTRWITTTTHHDLHHSHGRYNYGLYFTWWDRWMNTEHPEYRARFAAVVNARRRIALPAREAVK